MQSISESKKRGINEEKLRSFEELAKRKLAEISLNSSPSGELINRLLNLYEDSNIIESEKTCSKNDSAVSGPSFWLESVGRGIWTDSSDRRIAQRTPECSEAIPN
jgi:hypothetical protein